MQQDHQLHASIRSLIESYFSRLRRPVRKNLARLTCAFLYLAWSVRFGYGGLHLTSIARVLPEGKKFKSSYKWLSRFLKCKYFDASSLAECMLALILGNFPNKGSPERRARHICSSVLNWAIEFPEKRKAAVQLNVSDLITPETCMRTAAQRETIERTLSALETGSALCGLPPGFATATMAAMQEQQWNSSRNSRSSAKSSLSRLFKSSGGRGDEIVVRPNKRVTRSRTHVRSLGRSGLLDLMAGRREGHWLPANGKYSGISSKKIAARSTICQIWRNEIDISATSSAC